MAFADLGRGAGDRFGRRLLGINHQKISSHFNWDLG
jgi:hypothetical protein